MLRFIYRLDWGLRLQVLRPSALMCQPRRILQFSRKWNSKPSTHLDRCKFLNRIVIPHHSYLGTVGRNVLSLLRAKPRFGSSMVDRARHPLLRHAVCDTSANRQFCRLPYYHRLIEPGTLIWGFPALDLTCDWFHSDGATKFLYKRKPLSKARPGYWPRPMIVCFISAGIPLGLRVKTIPGRNLDNIR